jgi:hypothetical protein
MQQVMRPYATAGIALVGASIIAVTPIAAPLPEIQTRPVQLVDAWSDLVTETTANLQSIADNSDPTAISSLFSELGTNPSGVIDALFNLTPTVTSDLTTLPGTINIELPPGLELLLAQLGAEGATFNAIGDVFAQLSTDPSSLLEAPATILNAFLNGQDDISLLNGIISFTGFNGILAPLTDASINLNLPDLLDALGVGDLSLSNIDLGSLLGLDNLDLGGLIDALGLNTEGLGTLLGDPTLGSILNAFGLGDLGLGNLGLDNVLNTLGLDLPLNNLGLDQVLDVFGISGNVGGDLANLLDGLGLGTFLDEGLGTVLGSPAVDLLSDVLGGLNSTLAGVLNAVPGVGLLLGPLINDLLNPTTLAAALNTVTIGDLLDGQSIDTTVSALLSDFGVTVPNDLTIGGILEGLGAPSSIGDLTLGGLLGGLSLDNIDLTQFLNGLDLNLGDLLSGLGLSDLPLDISNLGDLTDLTLSGLLGDLGLGDIAMINIDGFGGLGTLLADVIPQQILAAL